MAGEIQFSYRSALTCYALVRNKNGLVWNNVSQAFEVYSTGSFGNYVVSTTEEGTASAYYIGNFPSAIGPGDYNVVAKQQIAGSPAETDPTIAVGDIQWNGSNVLPLSDLATSGQIGQFGPIRIARGVMIQNFPIYLKSSIDHITPFTSGIVSGQIARDNGSFVVLQSGSFTEGGLGFYVLSALTSGDLLGNTIRLLFTATNVSGGTSDPLPMSFITQKTSGQ